MSRHTLTYSLDSKGIAIIGGCAMNAVIEEQEEAIKVAFRKIQVVVDLDDDYGFCNIVAVEGMPVERN